MKSQTEKDFDSMIIDALEGQVAELEEQLRLAARADAQGIAAAWEQTNNYIEMYQDSEFILDMCKEALSAIAGIENPDCYDAVYIASKTLRHIAGTPTVARARLDEDGTAEPLTKIVARVPANDQRVRVHFPHEVIEYELRPTGECAGCLTGGPDCKDEPCETHGARPSEACPSCPGRDGHHALSCTQAGAYVAKVACSNEAEPTCSCESPSLGVRCSNCGLSGRYATARTDNPVTAADECRVIARWLRSPDGYRTVYEEKSRGGDSVAICNALGKLLDAREAMLRADSRSETPSAEAFPGELALLRSIVPHAYVMVKWTNGGGWRPYEKAGRRDAEALGLLLREHVDKTEASVTGSETP